MDEPISKLAEDYSKILDIDTTLDKLHLDNEIENMMTHLEEYKTFLKQNCSENKKILDEQVPKIFSHYQVLLRTFQSIDNLESLVGEVKSDLLQLEVAVSKAEKDLRVGPNITDVLKPLLFKKEHPNSYVAATDNENFTFTPPVLKFSPENYFPSLELPK